MSDEYDPQQDGIGSYYAAIADKRARGSMGDWENPIKREVVIGDCRLLLGDCLAIMPTLGKVGHVISDPPYEQAMHDLHQTAVFRRTDGGAERKHFTFSGIDAMRPALLDAIESQCLGWFLAFCTAEGVGAWRSEIFGKRKIKFKTTCAWIKPDCAPKLNGQGPAVGYEPFITTWAGSGVAKWNAGGKRGVYRHNVNPPDRHGEHPTEKPWRLFVEILNDFTNAGDTILDPFMGSGSTGVACAKIGRGFIGIEIDEGYFNIACDRIRKAYSQPDFFIQPKQPEPVQEGLPL
jgi:site-specific DNA-methyltransferase (adenine-specific)